MAKKRRARSTPRRAALRRLSPEAPTARPSRRITIEDIERLSPAPIKDPDSALKITMEAREATAPYVQRIQDIHLRMEGQAVAPRLLDSPVVRTIMALGDPKIQEQRARRRAEEAVEFEELKEQIRLERRSTAPDSRPAAPEFSRGEADAATWRQFWDKYPPDMATTPDGEPMSDTWRLAHLRAEFGLKRTRTAMVRQRQKALTMLERRRSSR